jgi:hypothetical protein
MCMCARDCVRPGSRAHAVPMSLLHGVVMVGSCPAIICSLPYIQTHGHDSVNVFEICQ